jgi:glycosyltransferase involved in cell wall biosynthesis
MTLFLFYKSLIVPGGAERLIIEEYKAYKALGYDVKLVVFTYTNDALFGEDVKKDIIKLRSGTWLLAMCRFIRLLLRHPSSVVVSSSGAIEVFLACSVAKVDYSLHVHHPTTMNVEMSKYSFFMKDKYKYILGRSYEPDIIQARKNQISKWSYLYISLRQIFDFFSMVSAKHLFVLSAYARDELKYIYGLDSEIVQGAIRTVSPNYKTVRDMGNGDDLKILCVSRLVPQKRIDWGILAFSEVLKTYPSATMFIGGRGGEETRLKKMVNDLEITERVIFLGFIPDDDLLDYYSSADVFLSLDWADYNITVYEAISAGTKVVVSEEGEFDHELIGAGYIFRVNPKDIEAITQAIIKSQTVGEKLSNDHVERLLMPYTWTEYCTKIADIHGFRL